MKRVLCVGECMLELKHAAERTLQLDFAGDTYNTAVYLRRVASELGLEAEVGYLTGLGADPYSAAMRAAWRAESIVDRSHTVPQRSPGLYAIRTDARGERSFTYWRDASAARQVFAGTDWTRELDGDLVHLSGVTLQLTSAESREALLARLRALRTGGSRVSFDTNYRPSAWPSACDAATAMNDVCRVADIVLASRHDEDLLHGACAPEESVRRLAALGAPEVVLRDGADGAYVSVDGAVQHVAAQQVEHVVDTTAAGDASSGAYLAARLAGEPPAQAAAIGNAAAAVVIQHPGAITPPGVALVDRALTQPTRSN
jgi:2-dehydro-3-deoxygluconokinase